MAWRTFAANITGPISSYTKCTVDDLGRFWIVDGQALVGYDGNVWKRFVAPDILNGSGFRSVTVDPMGGLWVLVNGDYGSPSSVARFDGYTWTRFVAPSGLLDDFPFDLAVDSHGTVWIASIAGVTELHPEGASIPVPPFTPDGPRVCPQFAVACRSRRSTRL